MQFFTPTRDWSLSKRLRMRLGVGLVLSLLFHAFIVSLQFGVPGFGLPGIALPWDERRAQEPEIHVLLNNVHSQPDQSSNPELSALSLKSLTPPPDPVTPQANMQLTLRPIPEPISASLPDKSAQSVPNKKINNKTVIPNPVAQQVPTQPKMQTPVIARTEAGQEKFFVPPPTPDAPEQPTTPIVETPNQSTQVAEPQVPDVAIAKEAEKQSTEEQEQVAQKLAEEESTRQAQANADKVKAEADAIRQAALEAQRKSEQAEEVSRQQAVALALQQQALAAKKLEEEKSVERAQLLEEKRQEAAKAERLAMEQEARKKIEQSEEAARQKAAELARQKQVEELAAREKAQDLANRQKAATEAAAAQQKELDRITANKLATSVPQAGGKDAAATAAAVLTAKPLAQNRPLDLSYHAPKAVLPPDTIENPRRRTIFGSADQDIGLTMYIESWRLKIERNGRLNYSQSSTERAHGDPIVTVSIRSDGSIEDIVINRSSGRPDLDEAVRRITRLNARYSAFPPSLASRYDVIEIRRIWSFDETLRILEEIR